MKRLRKTPVEYLIKFAYKPREEDMAMAEERGLSKEKKKKKLGAEAEAEAGSLADNRGMMGPL